MTVITGLEIAEHGRLYRTPAYRAFTKRTGVYGVRSGRVTQSASAHTDAIKLRAHFDSWYWTGRGPEPAARVDPFRLSDITETLADAAQGLLDVLAAPSRVLDSVRARPAETAPLAKEDEAAFFKGIGDAMRQWPMRL